MGRPIPNSLRLVTNVLPKPKPIITVRSEFKVRTAFRFVLSLVEGVRPDQMVFTYEELVNYLTKYIITNKDRLIDERNISIALVDKDPLGAAFAVRTFHRNQLLGLLQRQLITYRDPMKDQPLRQSR